MQAEVQAAVEEGIACLRDRCLWEPRRPSTSQQPPNSTTTLQSTGSASGAAAAHGSSGGASSAASNSAAGAGTVAGEGGASSGSSYTMGAGAGNTQASTWGAPLMRTIHEDARMSLDAPHGMWYVQSSDRTQGGTSHSTGSSAAVTFVPSSAGTSATGSHAAAVRASPNPDAPVATFVPHAGTQKGSADHVSGEPKPAQAACADDVTCMVVHEDGAGADNKAATNSTIAKGQQGSLSLTETKGGAEPNPTSPSGAPPAAVVSGKGSWIKGLSSRGAAAALGVASSLSGRGGGVTSSATVPSYASVPSMLPAESLPKMNAQFVDATQQVRTPANSKCLQRHVPAAGFLNDRSMGLSWPSCVGVEGGGAARMANSGKDGSGKIRGCVVRGIPTTFAACRWNEGR
jgi:hypothetical protein